MPVDRDGLPHYKTGKTNIEADALNRIPREEYHELESPVVKAL